MKALRGLIFLLLVLVWAAADAVAVQTQFGDSGLLSQPTAETLDAGNLSVGLWANHSDSATGSATILPVSLTLGLGSFLEAYGSYPNLLFNDEEIASGRGDVHIGLKARFFGRRSSPFRLAFDLQGRRSISDDSDLDGRNSYLARLIASLKLERLGVHGNAGYLNNDDAGHVAYEDQGVFGAGVEFYPVRRLRLIAELEYASRAREEQGGESEATLGFQYFLSPHLTLNAGLGFGLTEDSPDWRALLGLSTSQGVGTFVKPVPRIIEALPPEPEQESAPKAPPSKIRPLSTLLVAQARPRKPSAAAQFEIPVESSKQQVRLLPTDVFNADPIKLRSSAQLAPMAIATPERPQVQAIAAMESSAPAMAEAAEKPISTYLHRKFLLPEFTFGFDQWSLSDKGRAALAEIVSELRREKTSFILRIDGHTDNVGSRQYNKKLSHKRAIAMGAYLVANEGVDPTRIFVKGLGEERPLAENSTKEGRRQNRRVELLVLLQGEG